MCASNLSQKSVYVYCTCYKGKGKAVPLLN